MQHHIAAQLTFFPVDSHANRSALPENKKETKTHALYGRKCLESLKRFNRASLLAKMYLESSVWKMANPLSRYALHWKVKATKSNRMYCQLVPLERYTSDSEFSLWLTPTASDATKSNAKKENLHVTKSGTVRLRNKKGGSSNVGLSNQVRFIPTPRANGQEGYKTRVARKSHNQALTYLESWVEFYPTPQASDTKAGKPGMKMQKMLGNCPQVRNSGNGTLNPNWVEWLMGFPIGWSELEDSEMP